MTDKRWPIMGKWNDVQWGFDPELEIVKIDQQEYSLELFRLWGREEFNPVDEVLVRLDRAIDALKKIEQTAKNGCRINEDLVQSRTRMQLVHGIARDALEMKDD